MYDPNIIIAFSDKKTKVTTFDQLKKGLMWRLLTGKRESKNND